MPPSYHFKTLGREERKSPVFITKLEAAGSLTEEKPCGYIFLLWLKKQMFYEICKKKKKTEKKKKSKHKHRCTHTLLLRKQLKSVSNAEKESTISNTVNFNKIEYRILIFYCISTINC